MAVSEEKRVLTLRERAARGNSFGLEVKIERIPESAFRRRRKTEDFLEQRTRERDLLSWRGASSMFIVGFSFASTGKFFFSFFC